MSCAYRTKGLSFQQQAGDVLGAMFYNRDLLLITNGVIVNLCCLSPLFQPHSRVAQMSHAQADGAIIIPRCCQQFYLRGSGSFGQLY